MSKITISKYNSIFFRVTSTDANILNQLTDYFAIFKTGAQFSPKFKNKIWDGKIRLFDRKNNSLPIGLWDILINFCKTNNIEYEFNFSVKKAFNNADVITPKKAKMFMDILDKDQTFEHAHDFQVDSLFKAINHKRGIIRVSMGGGKSYIQYAITRYLLAVGAAKKILLIVPNIGLVSQMYDDMKDYNWKNIDDYVDVLHSKIKPKDRTRINKNWDKQLLITTWQSIAKKKKEWFDQFDCMLDDECHGNGTSTSLQNIAKKMTCTYKLGFTGTTHDKGQDKLALWTTFAYLGPILRDVTAKELEDRKLNSKLFIKNIVIRYPEDIAKYGRDREFANEVQYIEEIPYRNNILIRYITEMFNLEETKDANVLVVVKHIDHLKSVEKFINTHLSQYDTHIIYGGVKAEKRTDIRKQMEETTNTILIATYKTVSVGMNVKNLQLGFFMSSSKSKFAALQTLGRGVRLDGKYNKFYLFDIVDDFRPFNKQTGKYGKANHTYRHYLNRKSYYEQEKFTHIEQNVNYTEILKNK